ncbi:MAG: D-aminoacyl-tRNA deacylase [Bacteroidia bacterium]|nr:D-aminoacyl-tRNA deacylase [Bacteroidia bacterium]
MRSLIQRVKEAKVIVNNNIVGEINDGLLVFLAVGNDDNEEDINWLSQKIIQLRIFSNEEGKMNKSIQDINGSLLIVSQFTLFASTKKGNRPSFINSAPPEKAKALYEQFIEKCESLLQKKVERGIFGADMKVHLINDGPVTIWIDTKNKE